MSVKQAGTAVDAIEKEHNGLVVLGVTETHLSGTGVQT